MLRFLFFLMICTRLPAQEFSLAAPQIQCEQVFFRGATRIKMDFALEGARIRYTLNGREPDEQARRYRKPLRIDRSAQLYARAFHPDYLPGETAGIAVYRTSKLPPEQVRLAAPPAEEYNTPDCMAKLVDGRAGTGKFSDGAWLGFSKNDLDGSFQWRKPAPLRAVLVSFLVNTRSWIYPPSVVEVYAADADGQPRLIARDTGTAMTENGRKIMTLPLPPGRYRNLRVVVGTWGALPDDHPGKGNSAWLFVDEIAFQ